MIHLKKKYDLTEEEIIKAKENCFILLGKTGTGKTSLLNIIYGENIGKVGYETKSETKITSYYCIKEEINSKKIYYTIIDTPGLYDSNGTTNDQAMKNYTKDLIAKENLKIKGILFLSNFQNERFDFSEIDSLFQYNAFFPLKNFWDHIILVFTHYYGDPDGDSKEEIKEKSTENLSLIFSELMEKIKEVSTPKKFIDIERIYINIHSRIKTEKQKKNNEMIRKDILQIIDKYSQLQPMYNKFCIFKFKNIEVKKYKDCLFDCYLELFLDEKNKVIYKLFKLEKFENKIVNGKKNLVEINMINCEIDDKGKLQYKNELKNCSIGDFKLSFIGGSLILLFFIGDIAFSFMGLPGVISGLSGLLGSGMICNDIKHLIGNIKNNKEKKQQIIKDFDIIDLIENEIIDYFKNTFNK